VKHLFVLTLLLCRLAVAADTGGLWSTAVATRPSDGWRIVSRYLDQAISSTEKKRLPVAVTVRWRYDSPNGMPSKSELDAMYRLEDLLEERRARGAGFLVLVQTGNNMRSWTFFARSESDFRKSAELPLQEFPVEIEVVADPDWKALEGFRAGVRAK
jgi:uncharacterized protein DUF695